jgi:hypothetical protein
MSLRTHRLLRPSLGQGGVLPFPPRILPVKAQYHGSSTNSSSVLVRGPVLLAYAVTMSHDPAKASMQSGQGSPTACSHATPALAMRMAQSRPSARLTRTPPSHRLGKGRPLHSRRLFDHRAKSPAQVRQYGGGPSIRARRTSDASADKDTDASNPATSASAPMEDASWAASPAPRCLRSHSGSRPDSSLLARGRNV